jgi:NAD(P)-dependent dehydrogenase (short-subunit alcohol dehydrogenase family)
VEALGGLPLVLPTDVADATQVERAADAVEREFGRLDVWVNNTQHLIRLRTRADTPIASVGFVRESIAHPRLREQVLRTCGIRLDLLA